MLNNVTGTCRLSEAAIHRLLSIGKAANSSNVMGATIRLGELYAQALA